MSAESVVLRDCEASAVGCPHAAVTYSAEVIEGDDITRGHIAQKKARAGVVLTDEEA